jgi:mono/diheme cytochrome c family protein
MLKGRYARHVVSAALAVCLVGATMPSMRPTFAAGQQDPAASQAGSASMAGSVLDGVFTAEQAARGRQTFQRVCASCHTVAEHTGRRFAAKWADSTLGEMFDVIRTTMPDGNPGSLAPDEYASVIAFMLKESGYPEGELELPSDAAALTKVRIEPPVTR